MEANKNTYCKQFQDEIIHQTHVIDVMTDREIGHMLQCPTSSKTKLSSHGTLHGNLCTMLQMSILPQTHVFKPAAVTV